MSDKWRFDDAYEKVYRYSNEHNAYLFYGTYRACGINTVMTEEEKIDVAEKFENAIYNLNLDDELYNI